MATDIYDIYKMVLQDVLALWMMRFSTKYAALSTISLHKWEKLIQQIQDINGAVSEVITDDENRLDGTLFQDEIYLIWLK